MYVSLQAVQEQAVSRAHISTTLMTTPAHGCKKTCITWWSDEEVTSKATEVLGRYQAVHFDRTKTKGIFSNCLGLRSQTAKWTGFEHWRRIWSSLLCSEPRKHLASYVLGIEFWPALALEPNVKYKRFSVELWAHSSWPKQNSNAKLLAVFIFLWNPIPSNRQISRADTCAVSRLSSSTQQNRWRPPSRSVAPPRKLLRWLIRAANLSFQDCYAPKLTRNRRKSRLSPPNPP